MKKITFAVLLIISSLLFCTSAMAENEKTDSFNKLMNTIVEKVYSEVPGTYLVKDVQ